MAVSFSDLTYAIRSMKGMRTARPGSRMRLNFPMRSTIHAVCCGTNRIIVLAGRDGFWKYEVAIPGPPGPDMPSMEGFGALLANDWEKFRVVVEDVEGLR